MRKRDGNGVAYQADGVRLSCGHESGVQNATVGMATTCLACRTVVTVDEVLREGVRTR